MEFKDAYKKLDKHYPNKVVNWEREVTDRIRVLHITNRDDRKNYMIQLFYTGDFIDYKEVED